MAKVVFDENGVVRAPWTDIQFRIVPGPISGAEIPSYVEAGLASKKRRARYSPEHFSRSSARSTFAARSG